MDSNTTTKARLARLRTYMTEEKLDAVIVQKNANLRWLTSANQTFDEEIAHVAFITLTTQALRTDSRYFETFKERLGNDTIWELDGGANPTISQSAWLANCIADAQAKRIGIEACVSLGYFDKLVAAIEERGLSVELVHLNEVFENLRIVKDDDELSSLKRAQQVTDDALAYILSYIQPNMTESEVRTELDHYMLTHGADAVSFGTICASGPNGALPHAQPGKRRLQVGDMVVLDFGALVDDYHADMTRTISIGKPNAQHQEVYDVVRCAHEEAARAVRPGVSGAEIHEIAARVIQDAGYGAYFSHGLGHGVGLEIHENPAFRPSWKHEIPKNAVITIEPGIYLPGEFGIRLEDTGVVSEDGFTPFTSFGHELLVAGA